jgi:hypothetical protein
MDWDRIENARNRARSIFAVTCVAIALVVFAASAPGSQGLGPMFGRPGPGVLGIPIDTLTLAVGVFGVLVGLAWMWRIYRAPTKVEGAHWCFHDD